MKRLFFLALGALAVSSSACSAEEEPVPPPPGKKSPLTEVVVEGSGCTAVQRSFELDPPYHVGNCSPLEFGTNPPSSGTHYGTWAAFRSYDTAVPRGFWVHSMEHGAVVVAYSCSDCADEVAAAEAAIAAAGPDPACPSGESRLILTPDPLLDTRWAAASWGHTLTADCFDADVFGTFIAERRGHGPEAVCADGRDPFDPPC